MTNRRGVIIVRFLIDPQAFVYLGENLLQFRSRPPHARQEGIDLGIQVGEILDLGIDIQEGKGLGRFRQDSRWR